MSTRERKIKFIADGYTSIDEAVIAAFRKHGTDWLTDDQLADIVEMQVKRCRFMQHLHMENRKRRRAS